MKPIQKANVLVIGLGQIGGSIAIELRRTRIVDHLLGFDVHRETLRRAEREGIVDAGVRSIAEGIRQADIIILAAPIRSIILMLPSILSALRPDQVCFDTAGTKQRVMEIAALTKSTGFVGGHPIAGTEKFGLAGAVRGLFDGRTFVLTPSEFTSKRALSVVRRLAREIGAKPLVMPAAAHDCLLARTSHLPYAIALGLSHVAMKSSRKDPNLWRLIGGSYASATRVARSSPNLTEDMLSTNASEVSSVIDEMIAELCSLKGLIGNENKARLSKYIRAAHRRVSQYTSGPGERIK